MSQPAETTHPPRVTDVDPDLLEQWAAEGDTLLVDVREDFEHAEERIDGALLHPLSAFDPETLRTQAGGRRVVFQCRTGKRSHEAAERFGNNADRPALHLAGGIEQWKARGKPVVRPASAPKLPVMRQVQITAGALVASGVGLGVMVSPWFLVLPGFVGCGLVFAGISGWCGMAKLLAAMPWNRIGAHTPRGGGTCTT